MNQKHSVLHTVLITGARRGIGAALAQELSQNGFAVHAMTHAELDITSPPSITKALRKLELPSLDVLINNAGVYLDGEKGLEDLLEDDIRKSFEINVIGTLNMTKAALPLLKKAETPIVANISSLMGSIADNGSGGSYAYRMSKAAINMFTKSLAADYPNLIALALHPGWVRTEMGGPNAPTMPEQSARGLAQVLLKANLEMSGRFFDFEGDELPW